jgi:hypothetical protein
MLTRPLTLQPKNAKAPASGGPAAWWKLDETTGAEVADASGHNHPARIQGAAHWTPGQGKFGGAFELDGAETLLNCGDAADFDFRDAFTVSLWIKPRDFKKLPQTLLAKGGDAWDLQATGKKGEITFDLSGPQPTGKDRRKGSRAVSKRALDDGQWHHIAAAYDGQRIAIFVDGVLEDSVTASGPVAMNTEPLSVGGIAGTPGQRFNGSVDDVRLYNRGLTDQEIKALKDGKSN